MSDPVLISQIITSLGLSGKEAEKKRQELEKLSNDELNNLLSNMSSYEPTDVGSFAFLSPSVSKFSGAIFNPGFSNEISDLSPEFSSSSAPESKKYNTAQQKELDIFMGDFLYNSASLGYEKIKEYNDSIGCLNFTDRIVNGVKVIFGQKDRIELEEDMQAALEDAQKLQDIAHSQPGSFEFHIERKFGIPYSHANVEKLKQASEEFTRVTAYHEKSELLKDGFSEVKDILRREQEYKQARKHVRGAAAASLQPPEVSSHEKFGEVLLQFCNGDQNLVSEYMKSLTEDMGSRSEIEKNLPKIMDELIQKSEAQEKTALGNKSYSQYRQEYETACKKVFGTKDYKETAENFVEKAKTQAAYTEIGLTIATSLLLPSSSIVKKGVQKAAAKYGERAAMNMMKGTMTAATGSIPAVLSTLNAATSEAGFTPQAIEEIKEKFKNGLMYGGFGAYVSSPLGMAVEKILTKNPSMLSNIVSKTMGAATETSADVLFDRMTSDLSFVESLKQNGIMNFGMMIAGGQVNRALSKLSVTKVENGAYSIKDETGKEVFKAEDKNALTGYILAKGMKENASLIQKTEKETAAGTGNIFSQDKNITAEQLAETEISKIAQELTEGESGHYMIDNVGEVKISKLEGDKFNYKILKKESEINSKIPIAQNKNALINAITEIISDENFINTLKNLPEQDVMILKNVFNDISKSDLSFENFVNVIQTRCKNKNTNLSDELKFVDKILKAPSSEDSAALIDCKSMLRIPHSNKELDIVERLLELQTKCQNPVLNIDNILYLSAEFKDISDIELLVKRIEAKNPDGTFKYGVGDFYNKYDIDPSFLNADKEEWLTRYKDSPDMQNKLKSFFQNADNNTLKNFMMNFSLERTRKTELLAYLRNNNPDMIMSDIAEGMSCISDVKLKNMIQTSLDEIESMNLSSTEKTKKLKEQRLLIDAYNNLNKTYSTIDNEDRYWKEYLTFLKEYDPELRKTIRGEEFDLEIPENIKNEKYEVIEKNKTKIAKFKDYIRNIYLKFKEFMSFSMDDEFFHPATLDVNTFIATRKNVLNRMASDFEESQRIENFVYYCKNHNDEISKYVYNNVYVNREGFIPEIRQKLIEISDKYNVKIFVDSSSDYDVQQCLNLIEQEFGAWDKASNGSAKFPPVVDFTTAKRAYIDNTTAYGKSTASGFSETQGSGSISLYGMGIKRINNAFRHEMMHTNDLKQLDSFEYGFVVKENDKIIAEKCKYYDDFVKLGIDKGHIKYAYNNPREFIAVAAESNKLNECSPEFKQLLIDFGMPEWVFKLDEQQ